MIDRKIKVLMIEDNPGDVRLIKEMLGEATGAQFNLECVDRLKTGLKRLTEGGIDLVFLDLGLPDSQGIHTFLRVKSQEQKVPIIVLTGLEDEELAIKAVRNGAQDYLVKGQVDGNLLVHAIRYAIERKRVEQSLRESEEMYRTLMKTSPDAVTVTDLEANIIEVSQQTLILHGFKRAEELIGRNALELIAPEEHEKAIMKIEETLKEGSVRNVECILLRKDGTRFIGELNASLIKDAYGEPKALIATTRDITERKQAEKQIKASLKEKEVLLKEIHHRVKNNMQIISSLLRLQSWHIKDKKMREMFNVSQDRIKSMALIHEKLYQSKDLVRIDFSDYMRSLTDNIFSIYRTGVDSVDIKLDIKEFYIDIDTAIPLGLIVNELVSNSLKHGFPKERMWGERGKSRGEILLSLCSDDEGRVIFVIRDNGVGLPKDFDFRKSESLGLKLVNDLVDQLEGSIEHQRGKGTFYKIAFKVLK